MEACIILEKITVATSDFQSVSLVADEVVGVVNTFKCSEARKETFFARIKTGVIPKQLRIREDVLINQIASMAEE